MPFFIPVFVQSAVDRLNSAGFKAYLVGGCVRDMMLSIEPYDYDIATNAKPEVILSLFEKCVPTGIKHGTVTVIIDDIPLEVTTFRTESGYSDLRHPEKVEFVGTIKEDLARRDFTVNAMAYNSTEGLIDFFGGSKDLKGKILRTVGDPKERFSEDALRILRLFRFSSTLGFNIDKKTLNAAVMLGGNLKNVSTERIAAELKRCILGENPAAITPLIESGALDFLGIRKADLSDICNLPKGDIRLFAFLYLCAKDLADTALRLKLSLKERQYIDSMRDITEKPIECTRVSIKYALCRYENVFEDFLLYKEFIEKADTKKFWQIYKEIKEKKEPYKISKLNITGDDLLNLGLSGKQVGDTLNFLLDTVIKDPTLNEKQKLKNLIKCC